MAMDRRNFLGVAVAGLAATTAQGADRLPQARSYTLVDDSLGKILKTPDGRVVFEYMTKKPSHTRMNANSVCCFYPLNTPSGQNVAIFGIGHAHYRGLFFAWHTIDSRERATPPARPPGFRKRLRARGLRERGFPRMPTGPNAAEIIARMKAPDVGNLLRGDYWGWGRYAPLQGRVIENRSIHLSHADANSAQIEVENAWLNFNRAILHEQTTIAVHEVPSTFVTDLTYRFTPVNNMDMTLNEWSFGGLCLAGRSDAVSGHYLGPEGVVSLPNPSMVDGNTDYPPAAWYSRISQLSNGKTVGGAVLNHASNPPTRWWNPPTTACINPSIVTYKPVSVPLSKTLTLRYRILAYDCDLPGSTIDDLSNDWQES